MHRSRFFVLAVFGTAAAICAVCFVFASSTNAAPARVDVCHIPPGDPDNFHTITVSENALPAHLSHGDLAGSCGDFCGWLCDDGDACTIDACDETEQCFYPPVDCTDGNVCTEDLLCDPLDGCLSEVQIGQACDDGDACTAPDSCDSGGRCVGSGIPGCCIDAVDCDDAQICTTDSCSLAPGAPTGICHHDPVVCVDLDLCAVGACNEATGDCEFTPVVCDPGHECNPATGFCEPVGPPTESCRETNPSQEEIEAAVIESIADVANPWGNVSDFEALLDLMERRLNCVLREDLDAGTSQALTQQAGGCSDPGVNYCGPGDSTTNPLLHLVDVPACLNDDCCEHDTCYGETCVKRPECVWTPQSQGCDDALIGVCNNPFSSCGVQILLDPTAMAVCGIANCLNGTWLSPACVAAREGRLILHPECVDPPSLEDCNLECAGQTCETFTTCNPGSGCESPVCGSLAEGGGICVEGTTPCAGLADCAASDDCPGGLCFVDSCCSRPVCVTNSAFCPDIGRNGAASAGQQAPLCIDGPTIGSCIQDQ